MSLDGVKELYYYLYNHSSAENHSTRLLIDGKVAAVKEAGGAESVSGTIDVSNNKVLAIQVYSFSGGVPKGHYGFELGCDATFTYV